MTIDPEWAAVIVSLVGMSAFGAGALIRLGRQIESMRRDVEAARERGDANREMARREADRLAAELALLRAESSEQHAALQKRLEERIDRLEARIETLRCEVKSDHDALCARSAESDRRLHARLDPLSEKVSVVVGFADGLKAKKGEER